MSWHSSKGSESETTVILGMGASSAQNPLHVAITRSKHRLLVLAERENIHLPFAKLVVESPDYLNLIDTQRTIESAQFAIDSSIETERNRKNPKVTSKTKKSQHVTVLLILIHRIRLFQISLTGNHLDVNIE
ncbi:hypothetical protein EhV145_00135 [Emiliania huxleyi virus 145]|nr:hypothetical protein EhV145_00135 [Emiliania huxleyi virus 145]